MVGTDRGTNSNELVIFPTNRLVLLFDRQQGWGMPKIAYKEDTLNGAASIIKYAHRDCYYLRVKREAKKYSNISLDTEDLDIARKNSIDSYMSIMNKPAKRRTNKQSFVKACEDYLEYKYQQAKRLELTTCHGIHLPIRLFLKLVIGFRQNQHLKWKS